jgi:hypothetical protein
MNTAMMGEWGRGGIIFHKSYGFKGFQIKKKLKKTCTSLSDYIFLIALENNDV